MKSTILSLVATILLYYSSYGQCLVNGDFANVVAGNACNGSTCPSICSYSVPNWDRTHGSPQIIINANPTLNAMYMWAAHINYPRSEGVAANYNFVSGNQYSVTVRINASSGSPDGYVRLIAANGIAYVPYGNCGDSPPVTSGYQVISEIQEENMGWRVYQFTYTANANYSRFWIYPYTTSSSQLNLTVDYAFICPDACTGTTVYNTGQVPPVETKSGTIYAGSSAGTGGSGTVIVADNQTTIFTAANEIFLKDNFTATVTSGQFWARIVQPCNPQSLTEEDTVRGEIASLEPDIDTLPPMEEQRGIRNPITQEVQGHKHLNDFVIYPNPSSGQVFIQPGNKMNGPFSVIVFDNNGRMLQRRDNIATKGMTMIDLSKYRSGYYLIQVISKDAVMSEKIFVK